MDCHSHFVFGIKAHISFFFGVKQENLHFNITYNRIVLNTGFRKSLEYIPG